MGKEIHINFGFVVLDDKYKKLQRVSQMQKGTEQPHVWRVLQDSIADSCVIVLFLVFGF